jgi:MFS family permease
MTATLPGRTHGLGLITKRVIEDLGMDKVTFATFNFWATMIGALFCLPCGWLVDRYGAVRVAQAVLGLLALSVYGMSAAESPALFAMGMILTRGFGQSMLSIISLTLVGKWFGDRVGGAMGFFSVLMSLSMAIATGVLALGVTSLGWRVAWSTQIAAIVALILPLAFLPEPGKVQRNAYGTSDHAPTAGSATLRTAIGTPCFWIFALSISFFGFVTSGVSLFSQYVLEERGFGEQVFQLSLVIGLLSGMVFNLITGAFLKSIPYQRFLALGLILLAMSLGMFPWITQLWQVWVYAILFGAAGGVLTVVYFSVWRHAFGPAHLGKIQAAAQIPTVFASAMGPVFVAVIESRTGSYSQVFLTTALVAVCLACIASCIRVPRMEFAIRAGAKDARG